MSSPTEFENRCRFCGCTDLDCSRCVEVTGARCYWIEDDLCSACLGCAFVVLREQFRELLYLLASFGHKGRVATRTAAFAHLKTEATRIASELPPAAPTLEEWIGEAAELRGSLRSSPGVPASSELWNVKVGDTLEPQPDQVVQPDRVLFLDACRAAGFVPGGRVGLRGHFAFVAPDGVLTGKVGTIVSSGRDEILVRWDGDDRGLSPDAFSLSSATTLLEVQP